MKAFIRSNKGKFRPMPSIQPGQIITLAPGEDIEFKEFPTGSVCLYCDRQAPNKFTEECKGCGAPFVSDLQEFIDNVNEAVGKKLGVPSWFVIK